MCRNGQALFRSGALGWRYCLLRAGTWHRRGFSRPAETREGVSDLWHIAGRLDSTIRAAKAPKTPAEFIKAKTRSLTLCRQRLLPEPLQPQGGSPARIWTATAPSLF